MSITTSLPIILSQPPLLVLYLTQPGWVLPLGILEGSLLYLYANCYPYTVPLLSAITLLRTLLLLFLAHDAFLVAQVLAGVAGGLFWGNCIAGEAGDTCLGCLAMRLWDGRKPRHERERGRREEARDWEQERERAREGIDREREAERDWSRGSNESSARELEFDWTWDWGWAEDWLFPWNWEWNLNLGWEWGELDASELDSQVGGSVVEPYWVTDEPL
ncbi:hypothetical protein DACRYDRAFT_105238 [Dacryopinax primogenitus]|uniref:Uncharacterized protein n=1 Tax=Dacryopinax primogenitus (strain DJM 731) TaxID=1858805 RepID=M5G629_DACPD|nr:uncharacterized protein DACRYDRAFT_105238 [Dacryopinax primogenitus]EJU04169.1 hypothetical protein DACRYDRAFT_105238 [Dacryopinax primogenitus]